MKFYLLAITAVLMAGTAAAQDVHLGFKAGLNLYNVNPSNHYNFDSKIGFHTGVLAHIHVTDRFAIQPEVMYSVQGAKYERSNSRLDMHYVNVPVLFQLMFNNGFRVHAGPQAGFLVKAESRNSEFKIDHSDNFKTVELSLSIGASYVHTKTGLGIDARYNHGLGNISYRNSDRISNRGVQVGLFYLFGHKS